MWGTNQFAGALRQFGNTSVQEAVIFRSGESRFFRHWRITFKEQRRTTEQNIISILICIYLFSVWIFLLILFFFFL